MFSIHPISIEPVHDFGYRTSRGWNIQDDAEDAMEKEKQIHRKRAGKRLQIIINILNNTQSAFNLLKPLSTSLSSVVITCVLIGAYTIVPVHNVYENPDKWFEYPLQSLLSFWPIYAAHILFDSIYLLNVDLIRTFRAFLSLYVSVIVISSIVFSSAYMIWTFAFGLRYPVPLIGYINFFTMTVTCLTQIWFQFPSGWRENKGFRKRLKWNLFTILILNLTVGGYIGFTAALVLTPSGFQWVTAIVLPIYREMNVWIITSLLKKCHDGDPLGGKIYIVQCISNMHASFLTYSVGTVATMTTSCVIIAIDFIINLVITLKIIRMKDKEENQENTMEKIDLMLDLVVSELTETLAPLTYLGCLLMAYYGPNAETIGNVRNSWFHFSAIEDLTYTIEIVAAFFFFDLVNLAISGGLIWKFCHINLLQVFAAIQNEFWQGFGNNLVVSFLGV